MLQPIFEIISSPENHSRIHLREWPGNSRIPAQVSRYVVYDVKYDGGHYASKKFKKSGFALYSVGFQRIKR